MRTAGGHDSYARRQSVTNIAEDHFEAWCGRNGWLCFRLGFDEKRGNVPQFWRLHRMLRQMPDFLIVDGIEAPRRDMFFIHVKGTLRVKPRDIDDYIAWGRQFASKEVPLYIAFVLRDALYFLRPSEVKKRLRSAKRGTWPDGKEYRELDLGDCRDHS